MGVKPHNRTIITGWHPRQMAPHDLDIRWTFVSLLTESLRLRGQLMRMAP
jgi:hypothetical protein